jgi:hypothetical protein
MSKTKIKVVIVKSSLIIFFFREKVSSHCSSFKRLLVITKLHLEHI